MKKKTRKKEKRDSFWKELFGELGVNILLEIIWNIILFIPKMLIRLIKNIW